MFVVILTVMPHGECGRGGGRLGPRRTRARGRPPVSPLSVPPGGRSAMVGWWVALSPFLPLLVIFAGAASCSWWRSQVRRVVVLWEGGGWVTEREGGQYSSLRPRPCHHPGGNACPARS